MQPDDAITMHVAVTPEAEGQTRPRARHVPRVRRQTVIGYLPLAPLAIFLVVALVGPWIVAADPGQQDLLGRLSPPVWAGGSWQHPLGTDGLGRDILARIATGARFSLVIGLVAAINASVIGVSLGMISALAGGWTDRVLTSIVTVNMAIPGIVIGIVITATLGQGLANLFVILLLGGWIIYARIVRLQALSLRHSGFIEASVAMGAGRWHVLRRHMLPNLIPTILVLFAQGVAAVMVYEATLTYLGLGLPIEDVTLGSLVKDGQQVLFSAWWVGFFPGIMIALAIIGFNFLADWIQARMRVDREFEP